MFSISEIMASPGPDLDGNVIPAGLHEGSAEILGIEADNQSILIAEDAAIYNVRKATCGGSCQNCDGATSWNVNVNPFGLIIAGEDQEELLAQFCSGGQYDYTSQSTWSSSNTSVATVQAAGLVKGVSAGSLTLSAGNTTAPVCAPQCNPYGSCPAYTGGGGQSPGTVQVPTSLKLVTKPPKILQQGNNQATNGCSLGFYGIMLDVDYQVLDQTGAPIANSNMEPQEDVVFWDGTTTNGYVDIGPSPISTTSKFTRNDGTFDDAPIGYCKYVPFNTPVTSTQKIQILLNGTAYPVRTNNWSASSTNLPNHGTVTNGADINASQ